MPQLKIPALFMRGGTRKAARPDLAKSLDELEHERLRIQAEINAYPAPIPACDVYFNDLLEQRSRLCEQLDRLRASVNEVRDR